VSKITRDSYNVDIRNKVGAVLTNGDTFLPSATADKYQYGYGIALTQTSSVQQTRVDDAEWDNIRLDLIKARTHQKGTTWVTNNLGLQNDIPGGTNNVFDVTIGDDITLSIYNKYVSVANDCISERFSIGPGQSELLTPDSLSSVEQEIYFSGLANWTFTVTFPTASVANQFFNSGGSYNLSLSVAHGTSPTLTGNRRSQSEAMITAINGLGSYVFDATKFYDLRQTTFKDLVTSLSPNPYSVNEAIIRGRLDNATPGLARSFTLGFQLRSDYTGAGLSGSGAGAVYFGDQISLQVESIVERRRANGTVTGPTSQTEIYGAWATTGAPG
jgi:hypothetical protein